MMVDTTYGERLALITGLCKAAETVPYPLTEDEVKYLVGLIQFIAADEGSKLGISIDWNGLLHVVMRFAQHQTLWEYLEFLGDPSALLIGLDDDSGTLLIPLSNATNMDFDRVRYGDMESVVIRAFVTGANLVKVPGKIPFSMIPDFDSPFEPVLCKLTDDEASFGVEVRVKYSNEVVGVNNELQFDVRDRRAILR